jgi:hypothetical protein
MSDYTKWGKAYYQAHREEILSAEKDKKRWVEYYEKNKEVVAERNRRRYYEKKGLPVPEKGVARERKGGRPPAPTAELVERFAALVSEMRELAPQVMRRKKTAKAPVSEEEPVNSVELNTEPPRLTVDEAMV